MNIISQDRRSGHLLENLKAMTKPTLTKALLLGFLTWLIPFTISLLSYTRNGELTIPYATFKSIMIVSGTVSGCYLLFRYFKLVDNDFIKNGLVIGLTWFAINIILDSIILIPMMKTTFAEYFMSIGLGYIALPAISTTMGYLLQSKLK